MNNSESQSSILGFKLQSYFATHSLLKFQSEQNKKFEKKEILSSDITLDTYFAIEFKDDFTIMDLEKNTYNIQQLKRYSSDFNINSAEIQKAICNFAEIFYDHEGRDGIRFSFLSTSDFKKESSSSLLEEEDIKYLREKDETFLNILNNKNFDIHGSIVFKIVKKIIQESKYAKYKEFYKEQNNILRLLSVIDWNFGIDDLEQIKKESIEFIKQLGADLYTIDLIGKEELLFDHLVQQFEVKAKPKPLPRFFFNKTNLELACMKFRKNEFKRFETPSGMLIDKIKINFKNMSEKITNIYPSVEDTFLNLYNVKITKGKSNFINSPSDEGIAYKEAVYEECIKYIDENHIIATLNDKNDIKIYMENLITNVEKKLEDRKKDFTYLFNSRDMLEKTICVLFDDCFIDFKI